MDYLKTERADVLDNLISSNENIVKCGVNDETIKYLDECYKLYEKKRVKSKESGDLKELLRLDYLILNYKRDKIDEKDYIYMLGHTLAAIDIAFRTQQAKKTKSIHSLQACK